jgi:hypothetical protein
MMRILLQSVLIIYVAVFAVATQADVLTYQEDVQNAAFATTSDCWIDDGVLTGVDMGQHTVLRARPDRHILIAFRDIIGGGAGQVGAGSTINSATLSLYVTTLFAPGYEANVYRLLKDWANGSEGTEAWSDIDAAGEFGTNWTNATEVFGGSVVPWEVAGVGGVTDRTQTPMDYVYYTGEELPAVGMWIDVDVTEAVQAWANGAANYGVFLKSLSASLYFASAENGNDALNPILEIDFVPNTSSPLVLDLVEGWNVFSTGSASEITWSGFSVTDGNDIHGISNAELLGWIQGTVYYYDETMKMYRTVPGYSNNILWDHGYWLWSNRAGLQLLLQ